MRRRFALPSDSQNYWPLRPKLWMQRRETTLPRRLDVFRNRGRSEPKRNSSLEKYWRAYTPAPRAKTLQLTIAWTVSLKSRLNSMVNRIIAEPMPPMTHVPKNVNTMIVEKASVFFHAGQLRGSFTSSDGWGIRTMSFFDLRRWAAGNVRYEGEGMVYNQPE